MWPGLAQTLEVGSWLSPEPRTQAAQRSLGETALDISSLSQCLVSWFTLVVLVGLVMMVTLQVELLLSLVKAGPSHLTGNHLITVKTFLIKHRHV